MAPPTIFTRPKRQIQGATSTAQRRYLVTSDDELRAAIGMLRSLSRDEVNDFGFAGFGGEIVIAAPFILEDTVEIPQRCAGLIISALGRVGTYNKTALSQIFVVQAPYVTIRGLYLYPKDASLIATTFVEVGSDSFAGYGMHIDGNVVATKRITVGGGTGVTVERNEQVGIGGTFTAPIALTGAYPWVTDNFIQDGGGDAILYTGSGYASIRGNYCNGADITSSGSGGSNRIVANTNVGTTTPAGSDVVYP